ncbi:hypothetical protein OJ252_3332 [Cryptosporidium canis]|uniref:Uncharacterized protein n=1 Tax=Cryptosporidium canis TaxID=195482 RepID=A0ABQ8P2N7_9CRYT|nr:hypothetical protein OJ252_3332 [Cryptosporidium canis]
MKTFNFVRLIFVFAIIAFFGNFQQTQDGISTSMFEQSFVRLKLRKPLSKQEKKELQNQVKILEGKIGEAQLKGDEKKVEMYRKKIENAKNRIAGKA